MTAEGWFRRIGSGRVEVFLKHGKHKVRASAPEEDLTPLIEWFESVTGMRVTVPWKTNRGPKPMEGQLGLEAASHELSSDATLPGDAQR